MTANRLQHQNQQQLTGVNHVGAGQDVLRTSNSTLHAFLGLPRRSWMTGSSHAVTNATRSNVAQSPSTATVPTQRPQPSCVASQPNRTVTSRECPSLPLTSGIGAHSSAPSPGPVSLSEAPNSRAASYSNSPLVANTQVRQLPSSMHTTQAPTLPSPAPSMEHNPSPGNTAGFDAEVSGLSGFQTSLAPDSASPRDGRFPINRGVGGEPTTSSMNAPNGHAPSPRVHTTTSEMARNIPPTGATHQAKRPRLDTSNTSNFSNRSQATPESVNQNFTPTHPNPDVRNHRQSEWAGSPNSDQPSYKHFLRPLGEYMNHVVATGRPLGSFERPRFRLLQDACNQEDCFYLVLHQVYCLKSVDSAAYRSLHGFGPKQEEGFTMLSQMLVDNKHISNAIVVWCTRFPSQIHHLLGASAVYQGALEMVAAFLELLSRHWNRFDQEVRRRGYPPLIDELLSIFATPSPVLQEVIFKTLVRRIGDMRDETWMKPYLAIFQKNRELHHRRQAMNNLGYDVSVEQLQSEKENLVAAYRNIRTQHLRETQNPSIPNISRPSQQNSPITPQTAHPQYPVAPSPTLGNTYGHYAPNATHVARRPSQNYTSPYPVHPAQVVPSSRTSSMPTPTVAGGIWRGPQRPMAPQPQTVNTQQRQSLPFPSQLASSAHHPQNQRLQVTARPQQPIKSNQPLLPPPGFPPLQIPHPNPSCVALHQAHLRSPTRKYISTSTGDDVDGEFYQYIHSFALGPRPLGRQDSWFEWEFTVPASNIQKSPTDTPTGAYQPPLRILTDGNRMYRLRCAKASDSLQNFDGSIWPLSETAWPSVIYIHVNGTELFARRRQHHGKDLPLDITKHVKEGANKITFGFLRTSAETEKVFYALAIEVIEIGNHKRVRGEAKTLPRTESLDQIKARLTPSNVDDDIAIVDDYITIDLIDPFTAQVFEIPARSMECQHRECFDLDTFLKTRMCKSNVPKGSRRNVNDEDWKCPICGCDARPQLLVVDEFLAEVRTGLKNGQRLETVRAILVRADGSWQGKVEKENSGVGNDGGSGGGGAAAASHAQAPVLGTFPVSKDEDQQNMPPSLTTQKNHEVIEID